MNKKLVTLKDYLSDFKKEVSGYLALIKYCFEKAVLEPLFWFLKGVTDFIAGAIAILLGILAIFAVVMFTFVVTFILYGIFVSSWLHFIVMFVFGGMNPDLSQWQWFLITNFILTILVMFNSKSK